MYLRAVYVADSGNHCIRGYLRDSNTVVVVAGLVEDRATVTDLPGGFADGDLATARFNLPCDVAFDKVYNNLLVADTDNHRIRRVDLIAKKVSTVGGRTMFGSADGKGTDASFNKPIAVAVDERQRVLYVADQGNHVIRVAGLTPPGHDMVFETLAGGWLRGNCDGVGSAALFNSPEGLWVNAHEHTLYVADGDNNLIRVVGGIGHPARRHVGTLAGKKDAEALSGDAQALQGDSTARACVNFMFSRGIHICIRIFWGPCYHG
eukprot:m.548209 g.548209  ORF g.548209 m.548209 type:complete len:263 (-) comp22158_c1_seq39:111-899(-)